MPAIGLLYRDSSHGTELWLSLMLPCQEGGTVNTLSGRIEYKIIGNVRRIGEGKNCGIRPGVGI